ncbi:PD-(D/E)XK nuclease family protein [Candidatus Poriferisocius sp.]|uniref:PD-(D/E)XK nuclease family protein n=1 Tax=Candidatus Poriferisocius sp. TaxID=3101276 RepID=UPI003B0196FF
MSIEVICTPYGPAATERLGEQIAAFKDGDPLAPVTVVVPTNIAGLATRRALGATGRGIAAVNFLKLFDLAERLAGRQMADEHRRRPLSEPVLSANVRMVLNADPGLFRASARHPATEQALVRSYRDLRELSDDQLSVLAAQSNRAADVVRICGQVRDKLKGRWYDGQDLNELAIEELRSGSISKILDEFGPVIVHLPQRVTRSQGRLVSSLAQVTPVTTVVGLTRDNNVDHAVLESVVRMGGAVDAIAETSPPHGHRIISTASADEEIRVAVREVVNAARDGIPLSRIAVLCGGGSPVIRQLQSHLHAAHIPFNGPSGITLADSLMGRGLLALLNLESRYFRRDEVFTLLWTAAPVVPGGDEPAPVMAWERISRQAGVARGADQWTLRLARHAARLREEAAKAERDPDEAGFRAERLSREADHADSLAQFMAELVNRLSPDPRPATWTQWHQWISGLIHDYLGDDQVRQSWPDREREAAGQIDGILSRLAKLDKIEHHPRPDTFRHTLTSELSNPTGRIGRVGHGVLTGRIGDSLGMELDRVILVGLAEGTFPHSPLDDPLLPDRERKAVGDDLTLLSDRLDEQHRHLLCALASAETATLVYARGDTRRASEQHPSRWLLDTASALTGQAVDSTSLESLSSHESAAWFEHIASFSGRVANADFPATDQEFRLQVLAQSDHSSPVDDLVLARGAALVKARSSTLFTRFDGNLAGLDTSELAPDSRSPTSLETWADCPMRYLFRYVLRVQTAEQPEELLEISALEKGSLIHEALEKFMKAQIAADAIPPPSGQWSEQQRLQLEDIGRELCDEAESKGLTGAPVYWEHQRNRIMADLNRFLDEDDQQRQELHATPIATEQGFGIRGSDLEAIPVELPGGQQIRFTGQADRVDRIHNQGLLVTDYKTGRANQYRRLDESRDHRDDWDPVQRGTRLQLPVYGLAARAHNGQPGTPVKAQYWFVTDTGGFQTCGYSLDERVLDRFGEVVAAIVDGIEAGVFCDRPDPDSTGGPFSQRCDYCNADRLGTEDQRRAWERKQDQAALASYRNLAEPPPDSEAR